MCIMVHIVALNMEPICAPTMLFIWHAGTYHGHDEASHVHQMDQKFRLLTFLHSKIVSSLIAQAPRRLAQASAQSLQNGKYLFQMGCEGSAQAPRRLAHITDIDSFDARRLAEALRRLCAG